MRSRLRQSAFVIVFLASALVGSDSAMAQGNDGMEAQFKAMLKNATLKGTWAPIQQGNLSSEKGGDSYRISRVEKIRQGKVEHCHVTHVSRSNC